MLFFPKFYVHFIYNYFTYLFIYIFAIEHDFINKLAVTDKDARRVIES